MGRFWSSRGRGRSCGVAPGHLRRGVLAALPLPCVARAGALPHCRPPAAGVFALPGARPAAAPGAPLGVGGRPARGSPPCGLAVRCVVSERGRAASWSQSVARPENTSQLAGARRSLGARPGPRRGRGRTCTLRSPFCAPAAACPSPSWGVPEHGDPTRGQAARWVPWGRHRLLRDGPRGGRQRPRPPRVRLKTLVTAAGRRARPDTRGGVEPRGGSAGFRLCVLSKSEKRATGRAMGAEGA